MNKICIKLVSAAIIIGMIAMPFSITDKVDSVGEGWDQIINDNTMEACYTSTDTINYSGSKVNVSTAVGVWNCFWNPSDHVWQYDYNISGTGFSGRYNIDGASVEIIGPSDPESTLILYDKNHSVYSWSVPSSDEDEIEKKEAVSQLLFDVLLALIPIEDAFEDAWTVASDIIELVGDGCNNHESGDNQLRYFWEWSPNVNKTAQQIRIVAEMGKSETQSFTVEYKLHGSFGSLSPGIMRLTMTSPTTDGYPDEMTPLQRESAGIRTVQNEDLVTFASELNLTPSDVIQLLSTQQEEFYFAISTPTCEIIEESYKGSLESRYNQCSQDISMNPKELEQVENRNFDNIVSEQSLIGIYPQIAQDHNHQNLCATTINQAKSN